MKRIFAIFILFLFTTLSFGQGKTKTSQKKKDDFFRQIDRINKSLAFYEKLSPFSDNDNRFELIDSTRDEIMTQLLDVLNDRRILKYQMEKLLNQNDLTISNSADKKIYLFSLDEKTGGSFRSSKVILHYRLSNGTVKGELFGEAGTAMGASTYGEIYLLDSAEQKYFVIGGVRTCTTCCASVAITIKIGTDSYQTDLIAQYDGRVSHLTLFEYNSIEKIFTYEYEAPDEDDAFYGGDHAKGQLQYKYKYKYLNGSFEEIE